MREMSFYDWSVVIRLLIGGVGVILACVLGVLDLHKRAGRWPWEKR